jgi:hypothetical protein
MRLGQENKVSYLVIQFTKWKVGEMANWRNSKLAKRPLTPSVAFTMTILQSSIDGCLM